MLVLENIDWLPEIKAIGSNYPIPGLGSVPRVTSICEMVGTWGQLLNNWYATEERRAIFETVRAHWGWGHDMDAGSFLAMIESHMGDGKAAVKAKDKAADIGTEVHKAIQAHLRRELGLLYDMPVLGDGATLGYMAWEDWWRASGYRALRVEQLIAHPEHRYAGQLDCLALDRDGVPTLLDWKSSNYIVLKHHLQVASYLEALRLLVHVPKARIVRVPKTLDRIDVEDRPLGDLYDPMKKQSFTVPAEKLMDCFLAARMLYATFIERNFSA